MGDQDHRASIGIETFDQRLAGINIKVVSGLVKQQQMRRLTTDEGQNQTHALATRERAYQLIGKRS